MSFIESAKRTIQLETEAIAQLAGKLDDDFNKACDLCLNCEGRIVLVEWANPGTSAAK